MKKIFNKYFISHSPRATQKGFSLIEFLVYIGIFSILVVLLSSIFATIIQAQLESKSTSSVDQDGRYILARLTHDFQSVSKITTPPGSALGVPYSTLSIASSSGSITYGVSGSNLMIDGTDALNSAETSISNVLFTRIGNGGTNDTVQVKFTVTSNTVQNGSPQTATFQTTLGLP